jgi:hypothetical protein
LRIGDYRALFDVEATLLLFEEWDIERTSMDKSVAAKITQKRVKLKALREEIEDLSDYLDVLEARARDIGKPRLTHEEIKKRYGGKSVEPPVRRNGRKIAA